MKLNVLVQNHYNINQNIEDSPLFLSLGIDFHSVFHLRRRGALALI